MCGTLQKMSSKILCILLGSRAWIKRLFLHRLRIDPKSTSMESSAGDLWECGKAAGGSQVSNITSWNQSFASVARLLVVRFTFIRQSFSLALVHHVVSVLDCDPYGWFQWYCRFYQGRRCSDDARQVSRWLKSAGPKGRFRSQLCNKILAANTSHDDRSISPVIRQTMLHWGLDITPQVLEQHRKRVGK